MNRKPDLDGAKYWIRQSRNGANPDDLAYGFAQSTEFINSYGTLTNTEFLTILYDNMLGRTPDAEGFAYWQHKMDTGELSQHGVVRWIVANTEFVNRYPFADADLQCGTLKIERVEISLLDVFSKRVLGLDISDAEVESADFYKVADPRMEDCLADGGHVVDFCTAPSSSGFFEGSIVEVRHPDYLGELVGFRAGTTFEGEAMRQSLGKTGGQMTGGLSPRCGPLAPAVRFVDSCTTPATRQRARRDEFR